MSLERRYFGLRLPVDPQLAATGDLLAFTELVPDRELDAWRAAIQVVSIAAGAEDPEHVATLAGQLPRWSPDGSTLAFVGPADGTPATWSGTTPTGGVSSIWLWSAAGGAPRRLAQADGVAELCWSPDGSTLAFAGPEPVRRAANDPIVLTEPGYRVNGAPLPARPAQAWALDASTGAVRRLAETPFGVHSLSWSPDGERLAFAGGAQKHLPSHAYVLDADVGTDTGASPRRVTPEDGECEWVAWTPDGRELVIVGKPRAAHVGSSHLYRVCLDPPDMRRLYADDDLGVELVINEDPWPGTLPAIYEDAVLFAAQRHGSVPLFRVPLAGGAAERILGAPDEALYAVSAGPAGLATVIAGARSFGEVVVCARDGSARRQLTRCGARLDELPVPEERWFEAPDDTRVQGLLLRPPGADEDDTAAPGPLLLDVHGGPHWAVPFALSESRLVNYELALRGWNVLMLNPRGSTGYGEDLHAAVTEGWGEKDMDDFLCAIDALVAEGIADPDRLAVSGYSYGGFTTNYLVSHTDRFAAAISGGGISDFVSMFATSAPGVGLIELELGGPPPGRWDLYDRLSPLRAADAVRTPLLLLHGLDDQTAPPAQSEAFFTLLRSLGRTAELVLYPGANHIWTEWPISSRRDYDRRLIAWLERHVGPADPPARRRATP